MKNSQNNLTLWTWYRLAVRVGFIKIDRIIRLSYVQSSVNIDKDVFLSFSIFLDSVAVSVLGRASSSGTGPTLSTPALAKAAFNLPAN